MACPVLELVTSPSLRKRHILAPAPGRFLSPIRASWRSVDQVRYEAGKHAAWLNRLVKEVKLPTSSSDLEHGSTMSQVRYC
jgi:hypothetical protein